MATVTLQVCDLCGDGETRSVATVPFEVMNGQYDVDVCSVHQAELTELQEGLLRYANAGRLRQEPKRPRRRSTTAQDDSASAQPERPDRQRRTTAQGEENKELREWARQQGIHIGDRGRIPEELRGKFRRWRWDRDHPVEAEERSTTQHRQVGVPVRDLRDPRPVPTPPRYMTPPPVPPANEGRRLDPESALAVHSEGTYRR